MAHLTPPPRGVVFDLDGTLIDSRADIAAACNHVLVWAGRQALPIETVSGFVGDGARTLLARAFELPFDAPELDELFHEWQRYYIAHPVDHTCFMPGAERALSTWSARGIPLGLVTNKARAVVLAILDTLGVATQFRAVYAGGDGPLKPSPDPILTMAAALGVPAAALWMVGDGAQDVEAAHAAGARAIAIAAGFHTEAHLREAGASQVFATLDAFLDAC